MITCNVAAPQLFWFKYCRQNPWVVLAIVMFPNTGMWFERFVIIVTSIHRDFLPSSWGYFSPTWVDITLFIGTIGLFNFLFLLFVRFLPIINMFEVKGITPQADPHAEDHSTSWNHSTHSDPSLSTRVHA
jgi:molybdopterin-containing oxidoreductase family membrane subunit